MSGPGCGGICGIGLLASAVLPSSCNFRLRGLDAPRIVILLDEHGVTTRRGLDSFRNPSRATNPDGGIKRWICHVHFGFHPNTSMPVGHAMQPGILTNGCRSGDRRHSQPHAVD